MFESSQDILYLVLAFCALLFTVFVCWMLWYVISMLRDASKVVGEVRDKLHAIDDAIRGIREKIEHSAGYLGIMATGVKALIGLLDRHKDAVIKNMKKKSKRTKESDEE